MARRRPVAPARDGRRDPGRLTRPPFQWRIADDLSLPHVWDIGRALRRRSQRRGTSARGFLLAASRVHRPRRSLGFARRRAAGSRRWPSCSSTRGWPSGLSCPTWSRARRCRSSPSRHSSPWRSRTDWLAIVIVATYLTFFPVTIASLRGLRALDPRALELFRCCAATRCDVFWQLRLPTSVPYLFSGFGRGRGRVGHRRDHRRGRPGRQPVRPRQRDHQLQPALHLRSGAAVGGQLVMALLGLAFFVGRRILELIRASREPLPAADGLR